MQTKLTILHFYFFFSKDNPPINIAVWI